MASPGQGAPLVPIAPVRWAERQRWRPSSGGLLPLPISWSIARDQRPWSRRVKGWVYLPAQHAEKPVVFPRVQLVRDPNPFRRRIPGRIGSPQNQGETPIVYPWSALRILGQHSPRRGRTSVPSGVALTHAAPAVLRSTPVVARQTPRRTGRVTLGVLLALPPASIPFATPTRPARDPQPRRRRVPGLARIIPFAPPGSSIPAPVWYHVYANRGAGDPINYATPLATVNGLSWTSSPLSYPGDWKFGVRAFYYPNGLEEQNLDCAVELILDSSGNDITNRPAPPTGLRAIAVKGGNIKVEWSYPNPATAAKTPTGFHVYDGIGSVSYSAPVATVSYGASIANVWTAVITGLSNGTTYSFGVRAYNATAEETNTASVTCTSDATGPGAVQLLTAVAV